jgi:hypothetical protein
MFSEEVRGNRFQYSPPLFLESGVDIATMEFGVEFEFEFAVRLDVLGDFCSERIDESCSSEM